MKILIVDDEEISLSSVRRLLQWRGIRDVKTCDSGKDAVRILMEEDFDIVLLDLLMPEVDGIQVLETVKPHRPSTEIIILTAVHDIPTTVKAIRLGAYDYLVKPVDNDLLFLTIERAYERRNLLLGLSASTRASDLEIPPAFSAIITGSPLMKALISYAQVMARGGVPVLITGESGTGKELMARAIHEAGPSPAGPFIAVNVCAIPASMFESHFFGHVKGAFTGAESVHRGYFEQAHGGTLFLDEIGELPLALQAKFLRVIEEKSFTPLGATKPIHVDVRFVSASNSDLDRACREGRFRLDLLCRMRSARIHIPPLRERREDIPLLAGAFLRQAAERHHRDVRGFSPEAMDLLCGAQYPGNVRELAQAVESAVLLADSIVILPRHLGIAAPAPSLSARRLSTLKENDDEHVMYIFTQTGADRKKTARILGITVRQLQRKLSALRTDSRWQALLGDL
ncbi:MAG: sigma-54 dependent transcriptional regulator [Syntrophales bacterium]